MHKGWFALLVLSQLISVAATLNLPALNADLIDNGLLRTDIGHIWSIGRWMLVVSVVQVLAAMVASFAGARAAMNVGHDLRSALFTKTEAFSGRDLKHFGTSSLITRSTDDVQQVQMLLLMVGTVVATAPILMAGGAYMALREDVGLSWLVILAVVVLGAAMTVIIRRMMHASRLMQTRLDSINRVLREQLMGLMVIRAFTREDVETTRFAEVNSELAVVTRSVGRLGGTFIPIVMLITDLSIVAVVWFGGHRVESGDLQVGALTAYVAYLGLILSAATMAASVVMMLPRATVAAERIQEVLDTEPSVVPPGKPAALRTIKGVVSLAGVGLRYHGADAAVLSEVDLQAEPGQTVAIVGSMGAGKTSLVSLVARLQDATSGTVRLDGVDITSIDLDVVRSHLAVVPQRSFLFSGTVASNLRLARPDATDEELWEALEIAQARDFVESLAEGIASPVAQGGVNFSGGQRQRLCIARALVARPSIYLLDDPYSALDAETADRLHEAFCGVTGNATVLIVSQQASSVRSADRILVLDGGRVVGDGTHDELLMSCSTYQEIVESQTSIGAST